MKVIVVERQPDRFWRVWAKDEPARSGYGVSLVEALGDIIQSHAGHFDLTIETSPHSTPVPPSPLLRYEP
jgi:hypothetical protein